ncbi:MAG: hypothetical protein ABSH50_17905 [Bryobacteraceae bacterium]|jgi:hypothetical protein
MRLFHVVFLCLAVCAVACAQDLSCTTDAAVVPTMRGDGEAEHLGDILLVCSGGTEGASSLINVTVALNTNLTSRIMNATTAESEATLLIDDPLPGVVDTCNGFPYNGQVQGKPGILAGQPGSGNLYLGRQTSATSVTWTGVPFVEPGPSGERFLRLTNLRGNAATVATQSGLTPVQATVSASFALNNPTPYVGFASSTSFTFSGAITSPSTASLTFTEGFPSAFEPRILLTSTGTFARQDLPGEVYYSESQFTPCFGLTNCSTPPQSQIGFANSATLLQTQITGLGSGAAFLSVPNQVVENLTADIREKLYLMSGGKPVTGPGSTLLTVSGGAVEVIYEVASADASAFDQFVITATLLGPTEAPMSFPANTVFAGQLAPVNSTGTASASAPEPRFVP